VDNVAGDPGPPHDRPMEARVAVLEEIAATMKEAVVDFRHELRALRTELNQELVALRTETSQEFRALRTETSQRDEHLREAQERDFRILFSAMITVALSLAAMMAKGFHWF
jgi:hypothetical protein